MIKQVTHEARVKAKVIAVDVRATLLAAAAYDLSTLKRTRALNRFSERAEKASYWKWIMCKKATAKT